MSAEALIEETQIALEAAILYYGATRLDHGQILERRSSRPRIRCAEL